MTPSVSPSTLLPSPSSTAGTSSEPHAGANEWVKHMHMIERLADEIGLPVTEVKPLYEDIFMNMRDNARIHDYLPILVSKRVKDLLKH